MITAAATVGFDTYKVVFKLSPPEKKKENKWKYLKSPPSCSPKKVQEKNKVSWQFLQLFLPKGVGVNLKQCKSMLK